MKDKKSGNRRINDNLAFGLILGLLVGTLFDNVAFGLIGGLLLGGLPKLKNK